MKREKNPNQKAFKIITPKKQIVLAKPKETPAPVCDTASAVSFAMSIAQEMKQRQREIDEAKKTEPGIVYQNRNQQYSAKDLEQFKTRLLDVRDEILDNTNAIRTTVGIDEADDIEPDGGDGTNQSMRLDAIGQIEKSNKTLVSIEEALRRIDDGSYGVCMTCGSLIAKERLLHSPFVKSCTVCQQQMENEARP